MFQGPTNSFMKPDFQVFEMPLTPKRDISRRMSSFMPGAEETPKNIKRRSSR